MAINYPSTTCIHTLSVAHLCIPNDAENIWIIICLMRQESNAKEIVLWRTKECLDYFLILTRVSKTNGKDMYDCFINICADA